MDERRTGGLRKYLKWLHHGAAEIMGINQEEKPVSYLPVNFFKDIPPDEAYSRLNQTLADSVTHLRQQFADRANDTVSYIMATESVGDILESDQLRHALKQDAHNMHTGLPDQPQNLYVRIERFRSSDTSFIMYAKASAVDAPEKEVMRVDLHQEQSQLSSQIQAAASMNNVYRTFKILLTVPGDLSPVRKLADQVKLSNSCYANYRHPGKRVIERSQDLCI